MRGAIFAATLCLLLTATADGMSSKKKRKKNTDSVYNRKRECETQACGHLVPLEAKNCVHECVSPECYRKTYAEPLEDGEINVQLSKNFMSCAQRDIKKSIVAERRSDRQSASKSAATASDANPDGSGEEDKRREGAVLQAYGGAAVAENEAAAATLDSEDNGRVDGEDGELGDSFDESSEGREDSE